MAKFKLIDKGEGSKVFLNLDAISCVTVYKGIILIYTLGGAVLYEVENKKSPEEFDRLLKFFLTEDTRRGEARW